MGRTGDRKTSLIQGLAHAAGLPCETVIASIREPSDFAGLPVVSGGQVNFAPPRWAVNLAEAGEGLAFFDEISTAPPAARLAAAAESTGDGGARALLVRGAIGDGPGVEFLTWLAEADLPDPETALADPDSFVLPERGDRAYAALTSIAAAASANPAGGRWEAGWQIFGRVGQQVPDVAAAAARTLARARPSGAPIPEEVKSFLPLLGELVRLGVAAEIERTEAQHPGTVPGGWLRWAESVLPSRVDWRRVLAAELRSAIGVVSGMVDYSYRRPSRRSVPGVILPTLVRPVPELAVVLDTSGSMHDGLLARALAEVEGVLKRAGLRIGQLRVLAVDTEVQAIKRVSRASQVEMAGGGGTDMGRGISAAAELRPRPQIIIVLTDGFTPWPAEPPRGVKVVVDLLAQGHMPMQHWSPPEWARTVIIDE